MTDHAPLPWKAEVTMVVVDDPEFEASIVCEAPPLGFESHHYWSRNAAFIVKAVNNHDALVKALERLVHAYGSNNPSRDAPIIKDARRILRDVGTPLTD